MSNIPIVARAAEVAGISFASVCTGVLVACSAGVVPTLLAHSPPASLLVRQWRTSFDVGKFLSPGSSLLAAIAWVYAARAHPLSSTARLYGAAAVAVLGIHPWTTLVIMPTNKALGAQIREGDKANEKESRELVAKWGILNWGRALFPATAVVIGSWAMVAA